MSAGANNFGLRLRSLRREAGLNQTELGERIGKDQQAVSRIELGLQRVTLEELIALGEALGLSAIELLDNNDEEAVA